MDLGVSKNNGTPKLDGWKSWKSLCFNGWFGEVTPLFSETPGDGFHPSNPWPSSHIRPAPPGLSEVHDDWWCFFFSRKEIYTSKSGLEQLCYCLCCFFSGFFKKHPAIFWEVSDFFYYFGFIYSKILFEHDSYIYIYGHLPMVSFFFLNRKPMANSMVFCGWSVAFKWVLTAGLR